MLSFFSTKACKHSSRIFPTLFWFFYKLCTCPQNILTYIHLYIATTHHNIIFPFTIFRSRFFVTITIFDERFFFITNRIEIGSFLFHICAFRLLCTSSLFLFNLKMLVFYVWLGVDILNTIFGGGWLDGQASIRGDEACFFRTVVDWFRSFLKIFQSAYVVHRCR